MKERKIIKRPKGVTAVIVFCVFGWITTEGLWAYLHITDQIPAISSMNSFWERSYIGLVNGFTAADAIWSNLTIIVAIVGLWKMKPWGWTAAIMSNTIWVYTMTFTLVRDLMVTITFGMVFFLFFAFLAIISTIYLWRIRKVFWNNNSFHAEKL
jgi:hypothetical protein